MTEKTLVLYTFRRCPFAMRSRMALCTADINPEVREILLKEKPEHMLQVSPKGTVPVLWLGGDNVIDESLDIMLWALNQNDPQGWLAHKKESLALIAENDGPFKTALDRYKYTTRYPEEQDTDWRTEGEKFLAKLEDRLSQHKYLMSSTPELADYAIFPFIRQFRMPETKWFEGQRPEQNGVPPYPNVKAWLHSMMQSETFKAIMTKRDPWQPSDTPVYLLEKVA